MSNDGIFFQYFQIRLFPEKKEKKKIHKQHGSALHETAKNNHDTPIQIF